MSPDFLTRAPSKSITGRASTNGFVEVNLSPTKWAEFANRCPRLPLADGLEPIPSAIVISPIPVIGEFQPAAGAIVKFGLSSQWDIHPCNADNISISHIIFGQAQSVLDVKSIRALLTQQGHIQVCVISPSEVSPDQESSQTYWKQRWWLDSCQFGDALAGTWDVWALFHDP